MSGDRGETLPISVVVPLFNEEENVAPLVEAVRGALGGGPAWELLLVDDGSTDGTPGAARRLAAADPRIRVIGLARNYGQSAATQAGFDHARGDVVVTMDGDLQNDPRDIPRLVSALKEGYDLVTGYREDRQDRLLTRKVPSAVANRIIGWITGVPVRDNGCSLKAYRGELARRLQLYSDMHRFIPALAVSVAGARVTEIPVRHHPRRRGRSKYGLSRVGKVLVDLLTVKMIRSFRERPLAMFGAAGAGAGLAGLGFVVLSVVATLAFSSDQARAVVFPGAALLCLGLALYLVLLGFVGQIVVHEAKAERAGSHPGSPGRDPGAGANRE